MVVAQRIGNEGVVEIVDHTENRSTISLTKTRFSLSLEGGNVSAVVAWELAPEHVERALGQSALRTSAGSRRRLS
jgi:hypothetical protein